MVEPVQIRRATGPNVVQDREFKMPVGVETAQFDG